MNQNEYKTLLDVAEENLKNNQNLDFSELFNSIKEILFERWRSETSETVSDEEILIRKRGELYRLLTIDGKFFRNVDGSWTTIRPDFKN
ncbi:DNA-directed RNA polymerase subunit delta [Metamycoplasma canadense]|uniref:DNA-directed RNA polymerase subunit delta n=1 Tax=Metamycoplasma canadense TaxID=29554 RepID=UPI0005ED44AF|nr:hypothetical protein [Metamycoplasma canadense]